MEYYMREFIHIKSYCNLTSVACFLLKITVFWDVAQSAVVEMTDVLEMLTASVIRVHGTVIQKAVIFISTTPCYMFAS